MSSKRPRIGFVKSAGSSITNWSGTPYFIAQALQQHCGDVIHYAPISDGFPMFASKAINKITSLTIGKRFNPLHTFALARRYARHFEKEIENSTQRPDILFGCAASTELSFLDTNLPIVFASDVTFAISENYHPYATNLFAVSARMSNEIERRCMQKSRASTFPTQWAAKSATQYYAVPYERIYVAPYGANLTPDVIPNRASALRSKQSNVCRLLLLGVDWKNKGGEIAYDTLLTLLKLGVSAELTVCGCAPPKQFSHPKMKVIPFVNKKTKDGIMKIGELLTESSFLLLPTRAEAFGIVFSEASAFGLPAISTDTGGVSGVITNGMNGFLHHHSDGGKEYAHTIAAIWENQTDYQRLCRTSREEYEVRLNWDAWGKSVASMLKEIL